MLKKISAILIIMILLVLAFKLTLTSAQRYGKESDMLKKDDLAPLEEKIDKILNSLPEKGSQEEAHRQISAKLDQILSNQQRILSELEVVKVRATRR